MKDFLLKPLIKGATVILPLLVTIWFLWSAMLWLNQFGLDLLEFLHIPSLFPGMGLLLMLTALLITGLLFQFNPVNWLYQYFEDLLLRFPVIKTLYGAVRDFAAMFNRDKGQDQPVVLVDIDGLGQLVGFVTSSKVPAAVAKAHQGKDPLIAVYMPMSYMVGGYTVFMPESKVHPVDWSFEDAMRFALTAGVSQTQARERVQRSTSLPAK
ncbi:MAG: DUF502 domain-containing protein [Venatoribacter sp.]